MTAAGFAPIVNYSSYYLGVSQISVNDLDPICRLDAASQAIIVNKDSPYKSWEELLAAAKSEPGKLTVGVSGIGGMSHLLAENIKIAAGINLKVVGFNGGAPSRTALMGLFSVPQILRDLGSPHLKIRFEENLKPVLLSYDQARRVSRHPEKFGTGEIDGVIASETANNAVIGAYSINQRMFDVGWAAFFSEYSYSF